MSHPSFIQFMPFGQANHNAQVPAPVIFAPQFFFFTSGPQHDQQPQPSQQPLQPSPFDVPLMQNMFNFHVMPVMGPLLGAGLPFGDPAAFWAAALNPQAAASKTKPAAASVVERLPIVQVVQDTTCVICQEDMPTGTDARQLPCLHTFHSECVLPWLREHNNVCPLCRHELPTVDTQPPTGAPDHVPSSATTATVVSHETSLSTPTVTLSPSSPLTCPLQRLRHTEEHACAVRNPGARLRLACSHDFHAECVLSHNRICQARLHRNGRIACPVCGNQEELLAEWEELEAEDKFSSVEASSAEPQMPDLMDVDEDEEADCGLR